MAFREVLTVTAGKSRSAASSAQLIARDASRRASISGEIGESSTTEYLDGTPRPRFASRHSARSADAEASRMRAEANLFIGDLAKEVTEEELETAFGRYGRVLGVDVKRDRATSSSLGYGFVQYSTRREASEGKRALHRHEMHGRSIRVGWAQKNTNLFVGDLDASVTNDKLRTAFRAFGPIVEEDTFMKGDNYGFVRFRHRVHAEQVRPPGHRPSPHCRLTPPRSSSSTRKPPIGTLATHARPLRGPLAAGEAHDGRLLARAPACAHRLGRGLDATQLRACAGPAGRATATSRCRPLTSSRRPSQFDTYLAERYCLRESDLEPHFREFGEIESIVLPRGIDHSLKG